MRRVVHGGVPGRNAPRNAVVWVLGALVAAAFALLVVSMGPAEAAFPGKNGRIAFNQTDGTENNDNEIYTSNPDGSERIQITDNADEEFDPAFSPDGRSLVYFVLRGEGGDIYRVDLGRDGKPKGQPEAIVDDGRALTPAWSPDGEEIVFSYVGPEDNDFDIYKIDASGGGQPEFVADSGEDDLYPTWAPDGRHIAFSNFPFSGNSFVYVYDIDQNQVLPVTEPEEQAYGPDFAPNSRSIAYAGRGNGGQSYQIFTIFEGGNREQVTNEEGSENVLPAYSPKGDQIVYRNIQDFSGPAASISEGSEEGVSELLPELTSGSGGDVGTLGVGQAVSFVGRVPSDGGQEQTVRGTGNLSSNIFLDLILSGPNWGTSGASGGGGGGGGGGSDRPECTIRGTGEGDAIIGTEGRDVICAGGGGDSINALGGNDVVYGGSGDDSINGNGGDDDLFGEGGDDTLNGGSGRDRLSGGPGRDRETQ